MKRPKLEYYLTKLSLDQLEGFRRLVGKSPGKREQRLARLLDLIVGGEEDWERIYTMLYPNKTFAEKQIRNLRSDLLKRLEAYIIQLYFEGSEQRDLFLLKGLNDLGAIRYLPRIFDKVEARRSQQGLSFKSKRLACELMEERVYYQLATEGRRSDAFKELLFLQEEAFVVETLAFALADQEGQRVRGHEISEPDLALWQPLLEALEQGAWANSPLIQMYFDAYCLGRNPERKTLSVFIEHLLRDAALFSRVELTNLYRIGLNHCIRFGNAGEGWAYGTMFDLHKGMRERGFLLGENALGLWQFKAIVSCAVLVEELDWAKTFIKESVPLLTEGEDHPVFAFCKGLVAFADGQLEEAERWMNRALQRNQDPFLALNARSFLLRIFYETGDWVGMESMVHSFRLYLDRYQHLSATRIRGYKDFVRYFRRLLQLAPGDLKSALQLRKELRGYTNYAARKWFLEKLDAFFPKASPDAS